MEQYDVVPGRSWGKMDHFFLQDKWRTKKCDSCLDVSSMYVSSSEWDIDRYLLEMTYTNELLVDQNLDNSVTVIATRWREDITWLQLLDSNIFRVVLYTRPGSRINDIPDSFIHYPLNQDIGDEAHGYLDYMIRVRKGQVVKTSHYAFIHPHASSWHSSGSMGDKLIGFRYGVYGYQSLNEDAYQCFAMNLTSTDQSIGDATHFMRSVVVGYYGLKMDAVMDFCAHCCAQFVITVQRLFAVKLALLEHALEYVSSLTERSNPCEHAWPILLGEGLHETLISK